MKLAIDDLVDLADDIPTIQRCPICYHAILPLNQLLRTPCGHSFCRDCIVRWFEQSQQCPSCRTRVVVGDLDPHDHGTFSAGGTQPVRPIAELESLLDRLTPTPAIVPLAPARWLILPRTRHDRTTETSPLMYEMPRLISSGTERARSRRSSLEDGQVERSSPLEGLRNSGDGEYLEEYMMDGGNEDFDSDLI
jgi:hypothetical protein